jgi:ribokinase
MTRVAVVGHVEWVDFLRVDRLPEPGVVQRADRQFTHAGGGAVVAAAVLAELGADVDFFCAIGSDAHGAAAVAELTQRGIRVHAARRPGPTREVITLLDDNGERTIVTLGDRIQPEGDDDLDWARLDGCDGVYLTAGDIGAIRQARRAGVLVATPRIRERLADDAIELDALVYSAGDADEVRWAQPLEAHTRLMVATEGGDGGHWRGETSGRWEASAPPGPPRDSYGCGDSFAAGFTYGLASGFDVLAAAQVGARCGAQMLARTGAP